MARSTAEIYNSLVAEKDNSSGLGGLAPANDTSEQLLTEITSKSKVADWRLWTWLFAYAIHLQEGFWDLFRAEMDEKVKATKSHNLKWYQLTSLKFQLGYALTFNNDLEKYEYQTDDMAARIITKAATEEVGRYVIIKVAKEDGKLSQAELTAFEAYWNSLKDAGTPLKLVSADPDQFKISADIYYDPQVMAPDGSLIRDSNVFPVLDALKTYINNLDFNARLVLTDMVDHLQQAEGVTDPRLIECQAKSINDPYEVVERFYKPYSGHYEVDEDNLEIIYLPNV